MSYSNDLDATGGEHVLDNAGWHALTTVHSRFAEGRGRARRYRSDVSVFAAVEALDDDAWGDLAELVGTGGHAVLFRAGEVPTPPAGWTQVFSGPGKQMVLTGALPDSDLPASTRPLTDDDVPAMLDLIKLTEPGPFRDRTIELGNYTGIFDGEQLLAMAGQRISVNGYTEISAVCTHPDARRRGYAAAITAHVARLVIAEGKTPMLHIAASNTAAERVYEGIGFTVRTPVSFAMFAAPGDAAEQSS